MAIHKRDYICTIVVEIENEKEALIDIYITLEVSNML
mgnify:CR=1 FL=1